MPIGKERACVSILVFHPEENHVSSHLDIKSRYLMGVEDSDGWNWWSSCGGALARCLHDEGVKME